MSEEPKTDAKAALMRAVIDMGPLMVFFAVYVLSNIFAATGAYIVATTAALALGYFIEKRIAPMPLVTGVIVLVFGGLTIVLNDKQFIMMKPTIVNVLFATVLIAGLMTGRPMLKYLFGEVLVLSEKGWTVLTLRWVGFFLLLAVLNEIVWRNFSETVWVTYKVAGVLPLTILFTMLQLPLLKKYAPHDEQPVVAEE